MNTWKHYTVAHSIEEALGALRSSSGPARPIAGGTDYLLELQQGRHSPVDTLVDLTCIPELSCLEVRGNQLFIGAAVPVSHLTTSPLVNEHAQAVAEACGLIGGPQVRNTATLGGNVAHALPAADGMIGLVALDAQAEVAHLVAPLDGLAHVTLSRRPILSLFAGPGISTLVPDREILVGFYLPLREAGQSSAFARVMRPQGVALPILNLAVWLSRAGERIVDLRVAVGPAGPMPQRARAVEDCLIGAEYNDAALAQAKNILEQSAHFRTSPHRSTAEYRHHLVGTLFEKGIGAAWERAQNVAAPKGAEVE